MFKPGGDGGIDCVIYDPHPVFGGKFCIQAKLYRGTVPPMYVRDLFGAVQHEGATKGLLITTGGFGPSSYSWANGKPLALIDGTGPLLALCYDHGIPESSARPRPRVRPRGRSGSRTAQPRLQVLRPARGRSVPGPSPAPPSPSTKGGRDTDTLAY